MKVLWSLVLSLISSVSMASPTVVAVVDMGVDYYKIKELGPYMVKDNKGEHGWDFGLNEPSTGTDYNYKEEGQHHGTFIAFLIAKPLSQNKTKLNILDVVYSDYHGNLFQLNQYFYPENNLQVYRKKKAYEKFSEHLSKTFSYAEQRGARVINFSSSDRGFHSDAMRSYLEEAKERRTIVVVSAGNDGDSLTESPQYPCNYDLSNVICVGAVDKKNKLTTYSNYGKGVDIYARGNFGPYEGTSFSAPLISRAVGLIISKNPTWSADRIKRELFRFVFYKNKLPIFNQKDFDKKYF